MPKKHHNRTNQHHRHENGHIKHSEANGVASQEEHLQNGQEKNTKITTTTTTSSRTTSSATGSEFVDRVTSYPIVADGVSTVWAYAERLPVASYALSKANKTLSTVSAYQPKYVQSYYESYVHPHLQRADALGCKSLDLLQERFPVVNKPTAEVVDAVAAAPPAQIITSVRAKFDSTITSPAQSAVTAANQHISTVVDSMEATLDRYLPAKKGGEKKKHPRDLKETTTKEEQGQENQAARVYALMNEASVRLVQLVPRSRGDVQRIASSSAILQTTSAHLQFVQQTLRHSITIYSQAAQNRLPTALTRSIHQLQGTVTAQLNYMVGYVKTKSAVPDWLKVQLQSAADTATAQYEYAKRQYARTDISMYDKAKDVAQNLQTQLLPILQVVQSQIQQYTDKAQHDIKLHLGLVHQQPQEQLQQEQPQPAAPPAH